MLSGKGMYLWQATACENGDPEAVAAGAVAAGFSHVLVKMADGSYPYNGKYLPFLVAELKAAGIQVWGWQYVYGDNPSGEAQMAINQIRLYGVDGWVVNAELEYKNRPQQARRYMVDLRTAVGPNLLIGLSTYRFPSYHRDFPFDAFMQRCDLSMPQVYWMQAHNAGQQLRRTVEEYRALPVQLPILPTGAAFKEHGWAASAAEVAEFMATAKALNLPGVNFWEWGNCRKYTPESWEVIRSTPWANPPGTPSTTYLPVINPKSTITVTASLLNVRMAPSTTTGRVVGQLPKGTQLNCKGTVKDEATGMTWNEVVLYVAGTDGTTVYSE